jgi:hypothetical protein
MFSFKEHAHGDSESRQNLGKSQFFLGALPARHRIGKLEECGLRLFVKHDNRRHAGFEVLGDLGDL